VVSVVAVDDANRALVSLVGVMSCSAAVDVVEMPPTVDTDGSTLSMLSRVMLADDAAPSFFII